MKRTPLRMIIGGLAVSGLALAGCGGGADDSGEQGSGELLGSVETMFGTVEVPVPEDGELTIVSLGWSDAEVALALGEKPVAVQDWLGFGEEGKGVGPWATEQFGDVSPAIIPRSDDGVDYELVQSFEPDLILNVSAAGGDQEEFDRLTSIAPTVYGPEGSENFTTGWDNQTRSIAAALGKTEEGDALVAEVEQTITDAAEAHPEFADKTAVTGSKFGEAYGLSLPGDFRWDLLADLGFSLTPEVEAAAADADSFYLDVSAENLSLLEADVAVLFPIGFTLEELEGDELLSGLDVVSEDRAVLLDGEGEISQAFSAASPLSIPVALDNLVPQLAEAAAKN